MGKNRNLGIALAASAAVLLLSGCATAPAGGSSGTEAKITCDGGNACKGQSECHTANNACAGQNACKGQGYVSLTPDECKKATGGS
jgi:hypothetical protein